MSSVMLKSRATSMHLMLILFQQLCYGSAQDCLRPANTEDSLPSLEDLGNDAGRIDDGNVAQVIVTSYQFHCCGDITGWLAHVRPNGGYHQDGAYSINFQVWRPSPTVGSDGAGEYSLVGENRFTSIRFADDDPVSETPEPTSVVSVRPGDVVGFFQSSDFGNDAGIQLVITSYSNYRLLWYQTSFSQSGLSTLVAGNGGALASSTNAGIQLSARISSSSCTPLPTPPPAQPTTTLAPPITDSPATPPSTPDSAPPPTPDSPTAPPSTDSSIANTNLSSTHPTLPDTTLGITLDDEESESSVVLVVSVVVVVVAVILLLLVVIAVAGKFCVKKRQKKVITTNAPSEGNSPIPLEVN